MDRLKESYPVEELGVALEVSKSGFYAHRRKASRPRRLQDQELTQTIKVLFKQSRQTYGSPRLRAALRRKGFACGKNRINRLMRLAGLRPKQKRRFRPLTTESNHRLPIAQNWLSKVPTPKKPNQVWVADITYIPTAEGWLYLACELDLCSRRVTGWSVREDLATALVSEAWERAVFATPPDPGLLHHSDRGSQYASSHFQSLLQNSLATASMSRKANPFDNAVMESFFATLKAECFGNQIPQNRRQARVILFDYIETFYNPQRLHSSLGNLSPNEFEISLNQTNKNNK